MKIGPYLTGPNETNERGIYQGDAGMLSQVVPDESIDLLFTDPPYDRESIPLYWLAAEVAARVLKVGGALVMMAGGLYDHQIHQGITDERLKYFYTYHLALGGAATGKTHPHGSPMPVITRHKNLIVFTKGPGRPRTVSYNPIISKGANKKHHKWGQDMESARYMIELWTGPGAVVLDLFGGGGTTAMVTGLLRRRWLLFDIDPEAIQAARDRVNGEDIPMFTGLSFNEQMGLAI